MAEDIIYQAFGGEISHLVNTIRPQAVPASASLKNKLFTLIWYILFGYFHCMFAI